MASDGSRLVDATVRFGVEEIPVVIDFGKRRHLYISVNPDRSVLVKAPRRESLANVMVFVKRRASWIHLQRCRLEQNITVPLAINYTSGETALILGKQYTLRLIQGDEESVRRNESCLTVHTADPQDQSQVGVLVEQWYIDHAADVYVARLEHCFTSSALTGVEYPELRVSTMRRSWGTCSVNGWIHINSELVKTPMECIDYVIMHELCHFRHCNHSKVFYRLLSRMMPDWRQRKERLDRYVL